MSNSDSGSGGAFVTGFLVGSLLGAAAALIMAPQSGVETRNNISNKGTEWRDAGNHQIQQYRQKAGDYTRPYVNRVEQTFTSTRSRIQEGSGQVQERARVILDSGKERATHVREQVSSLRSKENKEDISSNGSNESPITT